MSISQEAALSLADLLSAITLHGFQSDPDALQRRMLGDVCRLFSVEMAAFFLIDETNDEWMVRKVLEGREPAKGDKQNPREPDWSHQIHSRQGNGLVRECLRSRSAVISNRVNEDERFDPSSDAPDGMVVQSMLCAPIVTEGRIMGALQLVNKGKEGFDAYDQELLVRVLGLIAIASDGASQIRDLHTTKVELEARRQELVNSRDTLRLLFDNIPIAIYIVDEEYRLTAINSSRSQAVDRMPQALVHQVCFQALFSRREPCPGCMVKDTFREGRSTQRTEWRNEIEAVKGMTRTGEEGKEWQISTYPIANKQGKVFQAIVVEQDFTERYQLENILARSEKLAVIGQLAAGVAHEINNPLTAIIANAQILQRDLPPDPDLRESVDLISRAGSRAAQVVRNLLDFARKEEFHLGLTDVNETVEKALEFIRHELTSRGVQLKFKPDPTLPSILASEDHLQSVWLNLLLNAIDALDKEPGVVTVMTRKIGAEIHISITDNGKGILPERMTRIFEPFYTTKEPGRGTGLGLSVSHRIIKQHGGHIRVESKVGAGSEFTVILPGS